MGKNKVKKPNKRNNPIYKKVTTKSKSKNKTKPVKTSVAKTQINNHKAREELDCKWKAMRGGAGGKAGGASGSKGGTPSSSGAAKTPTPAPAK